MTGRWRVPGDPWPVPYVAAPLVLDDVALVIVDMQTYWTDPAGPLGDVLRRHHPAIVQPFYDRLQGVVVPNLASLLEAFRLHGLPVAHVTSGSARADGRDLAPHLQRRIASAEPVAGDFGQLRLGQPWHDVEPPLQPLPGELVVNKTTRSAFVSTGLDQLLRHVGVRRLLLGGLATNACVGLTAMHGADLGYDTWLVDDACASFDDAAHDAQLLNFERIFGSVTTTAAVLDTARPPSRTRPTPMQAVRP